MVLTSLFVRRNVNFLVFLILIPIKCQVWLDNKKSFIIEITIIDPTYIILKIHLLLALCTRLNMKIYLRLKQLIQNEYQCNV